MDFPEDLKYTSEHEWIRVEGETGTLGITDYAQQLLGDVVYVELPEIGAELKKGEAFGVVESVKAASDIYTPASGEVIEINSALGEHPEYINQSPYGNGWIVKIKLKDHSELNDLMDFNKYKSFIQQKEKNP